MFDEFTEHTINLHKWHKLFLNWNPHAADCQSHIYFQPFRVHRVNFSTINKQAMINKVLHIPESRVPQKYFHKSQHLNNCLFNLKNSKGILLGMIQILYNIKWKGRMYCSICFLHVALDCIPHSLAHGIYWFISILLYQFEPGHYDMNRKTLAFVLLIHQEVICLLVYEWTVCSFLYYPQA